MLYYFKNLLRKILPYWIILWTHKIRAVFAAVFYSFPARKLIIIGVAGTKGKTTVCNLIARILEEDGKKVAMITTANLKIGKKEWLNKVKMTTPSSFFIQKFLRNAVEKKCDYAIIETTSHGLVQYRHWGIPYQIVVLTNLMPDHLDYHKTYENYRDSHLRLFNKNLKTLILNKDDERLEYFAEKFENYQKTVIARSQQTTKSAYGGSTEGGQSQSFYQTTRLPRFTPLRSVSLAMTSTKLYFSIKNQTNFFAKEIKLEKEGTNFELTANDQIIKINSPLLGEFNVSNCLAAVAVGSVCKISLDAIKNALEKIKGIEGRLEKIKISDGPARIRHNGENEAGKQNFEVMVDYAHSPDSLETFYKTVIPYAKGKIIAVLGACGDRDKTYRPALGKLAAKYADYVIITNEDPYSEKPEDIIEQVFDGVIDKQQSFESRHCEEERRSNPVGKSRLPRFTPLRSVPLAMTENKNCWKILDRRKAIKEAIDLAKENDLVLITGKGAEQWIVYGASGEKKVPWDDREVVREVIKRKLKKIN